MKCLLAKMDSFQEEMKTTQDKLEANQEKMEPSQEMKSKMGAFISWMDIRQARTKSSHDEMEVKMNICQEKMEAEIHSIQTELEKTIKHLWKNNDTRTRGQNGYAI